MFFKMLTAFSCIIFLNIATLVSNFKVLADILPYLLFCGGECNVHYPRSISGATCAGLLVTSAQPATSPHACAEVGLGLEFNGQSPGQKTNALPLCQRPGSWFQTLNVFHIHIYIAKYLLKCEKTKLALYPELKFLYGFSNHRGLR